MKDWVASHKDLLAIVISVIALCGTWIPFWWRDLRRHNRVDAVIMNFISDDEEMFAADVVYINMGNRPAAITSMVVSMRLKPDPNADPKDFRFDAEWQAWRGSLPPFTLLPGQIVTQSYKGEWKMESSKMGPPSAVVEYFVNFNVVDSLGHLHSVAIPVANRVVGEKVQRSKRFPITARLLPSPRTDKLLSHPRALLETGK